MGAGLAGVTSAWYLAEAGHQVVVIEREAQVASAASFANGGIIAPSRAYPWPSPRMLGTFLKAFVSNAQAVRIPLRLDPEFWLWGLRFLSHCSARRYREILAAKVRLARYSQQQLAALVERTGIEYHRLTNGVLYVYRSEDDLERGWQRAAPMRELGFALVRLDARGAVALEPALAGGSAVAGAIHSPGDEAGDSARFCRELAERCRARGVQFLLDCEIVALDTVDDRVREVATRKGRVRADAFVCALGLIDARLREPLRASLPVYPVKGYSVTVPIRQPEAAPRHAGIDESKLVTWCPMGVEMRLTGGAEFAGYARSHKPENFARLLAAFEELFPGAIDAAHARTWACLRPMTPESTPRFGSSRYVNLWFNVGHGHMGWALAAGAGRITADLVTGRSPEIDLEGLRIVRT